MTVSTPMSTAMSANMAIDVQGRTIEPLCAKRGTGHRRRYKRRQLRRHRSLRTFNRAGRAPFLEIVKRLTRTKAHREVRLPSFALRATEGKLAAEPMTRHVQRDGSADTEVRPEQR